MRGLPRRGCVPKNSAARLHHHTLLRLWAMNEKWTKVAALLFSGLWNVALGGNPSFESLDRNGVRRLDVSEAADIPAAVFHGLDRNGDAMLDETEFTAYSRADETPAESMPGGIGEDPPPKDGTDGQQREGA